ncbi:polyisoprenoid-binding protein YceI [Flavobacterium nitrogenifigens]|uniref:Polyisoprenoid-binding protein YceI n=2 Tax=Flavobacterium TaxID=237 RepID=A0A7W7IYB5_9FLAO|nr:MULTISPECIES: YceI family protein [Flavobacterium]MBB4802705.1 polyisoprenoid-binding protein YceI [Flavobacterium nitrogenifigens]MBB6387663.1 polyisoprenoid-binding protein YceI [Flavobacterium notoginsengisoli]
METIQFKIDSAKSQIDWIGRKVTGAHNGTIGIKEGNFIINSGKIIGGKIIIDIATIKILDVTDAATNAQFAGHLASDDFFSIEKFPTASFDIITAKQLTSNSYYLEGNLTIKDITHLTGFEVKLEESNGNAFSLAGKLVIDRTKYDIKFRSGNFFKDLGDTLIYNDFDLDFNITAQTSKN